MFACTQISRRSEQICGISATGIGCYGNAPETVILFSLMLKKRGKASDTCNTGVGEFILLHQHS